MFCLSYNSRDEDSEKENGYHTLMQRLVNDHLTHTDRLLTTCTVVSTPIFFRLEMLMSCITLWSITAKIKGMATIIHFIPGIIARETPSMPLN